MQDYSRPATGYPYPNPPPPTTGPVNGYPPPNAGAAYPYYYEPPQSNPRAVLYRRLFIVFMSCLLIIGLALFIFFLVVRPHYPDVSIKTLSVSDFNVSNSMVSGNWNIQFQFRNPNSKMSLYYVDTRCFVYYGGESLTDSRLPPFDQSTNDQTPINVTLSVLSSYLERRLVDSIGNERAAHGLLEFDVRLISTIKFRYGLFRRWRSVRMFCDDIDVDLPANSSTGKMIGPARKCLVF